LRFSDPNEPFQYLKGAIKSDYIEYLNDVLTKFQYLKGAIKSWPHGLTPLASRHFNT